MKTLKYIFNLFKSLFSIFNTSKLPDSKGIRLVGGKDFKPIFKYPVLKPKSVPEKPKPCYHKNVLMYTVRDEEIRGTLSYSVCQNPNCKYKRWERMHFDGISKWIDYDHERYIVRKSQIKQAKELAQSLAELIDLAFNKKKK